MYESRFIFARNQDNQTKTWYIGAKEKHVEVNTHFRDVKTL